jgi:hypothetical protein
MGAQTAQAAQPISQQQPAPQGKGSAQAGMPNVEQPMAQTQVLPGADSTTDGVPNQTGSRQTFNQTMGKGSGKGSSQQYTGSGQPNEFTMPNTTNSATSGQPQMGQPNTYSNTVGPWDNSNNQTQVQSGKGKGH